MEQLLHSVQSLPGSHVLPAALSLLSTLVKTERSISVLRVSLLSLLALSDDGCVATCNAILQQLSDKQKLTPWEPTDDTASTAATESPFAGKSSEAPDIMRLNSRQTSKEGLVRGELKILVFQKLDFDDVGWLNKAKMYCFALCMGYGAPAHEWARDYDATCRHLRCDPSQGLNLIHFSKLVDNLFNCISYCSDGELASILDRVDGKMAGPLDPAYLHCHTPMVEPKLDDETLDFPQRACETNTLIDAASTANRTKGLDPSLTQAGAERYPLSRAVSPASLIQGCRAPSSELVSPPSVVNTQADEPSLESSQTREELKTALFNLLDTDGDGHLDNSEFFCVATNQGFIGSLEEWAEEFRRLCLQFDVDPDTGLDFSIFSQLADQDSQAWHSCSDAGLQRMLDFCRNLNGKENQAASECAPKKSKVESLPEKCLRSLLLDDLKAPGMTLAQQLQENVEPARYNVEQPTLAKIESGRIAEAPLAVEVVESSENGRSSRERLKAAVFQELDADGDVRLNREEMRRFASHNGFHGTIADWIDQYSLLCKQFHLDTAIGVDFKLFCWLVDDESEYGCHSSDAELSAMLDALRRKPQVLERLGREPHTRGNLKVAAFEVLDCDCDARLNCKEFRKFASSNGFHGTARDWDTQWFRLCSQFNVDGSVGVDFKLFSKLLDDDSDKVCHCTDEELLELVQDA